MSAEHVLRWVIEVLEDAGISHMVTGSFASSFYGQPRGTQDLDIVIAPDADQLSMFLDRIRSENCYVDCRFARLALRRLGQFNILHLDTGWKVDLILRKDRTFSRVEMERRRRAEIGGIRLSIASPEDVVLAQLEWAKGGGSGRQIEDAAGILAIHRDLLDQDYLEHWVDALDLGLEWSQAREIASHSSPW